MRQLPPVFVIQKLILAAESFTLLFSLVLERTLASGNLSAHVIGFVLRDVLSLESVPFDSTYSGTAALW